MGDLGVAHFYWVGFSCADNRRLTHPASHFIDVLRLKERRVACFRDGFCALSYSICINYRCAGLKLPPVVGCTLKHSGQRLKICRFG